MQKINTARINWFIIKQVWCTFHKAGEFDDAMGCNHNFFYEIQNRTYKGENAFERIMKKTGISVDILSGKESLCVDGISEEEWEDYLNDWEHFNEHYRRLKVKPKEGIESKKKIDEFVAKVRNIINRAKIGTDNNIYPIMWYCKYKHKYKGDTTKAVINNIIYHMGRLKWEDLELMDKEDYELYKIEVEKQNELLHALDVYKRHH